MPGAHGETYAQEEMYEKNNRDRTDRQKGLERKVNTLGKPRAPGKFWIIANGAGPICAWFELFTDYFLEWNPIRGQK